MNFTTRCFLPDSVEFQVLFCRGNSLKENKLPPFSQANILVLSKFQLELKLHYVKDACQECDRFLIKGLIETHTFLTASFSKTS